MKFPGNQYDIIDALFCLEVCVQRCYGRKYRSDPDQQTESGWHHWVTLQGHRHGDPIAFRLSTNQLWLLNCSCSYATQTACSVMCASVGAWVLYSNFRAFIIWAGRHHSYHGSIIQESTNGRSGPICYSRALMPRTWRLLSTLSVPNGIYACEPVLRNS